MTPERRAEVVAILRAGVRDSIADARAKGEERGADRSIAQCDAEDAAVLEAAEALEAKPSESSMVQRIEALESAMRRIIGLTAHSPKTTRPDAFANLNRIAGTATSALDGPPDPERDREQRSEVERP